MYLPMDNQATQVFVQEREKEDDPPDHQQDDEPPSPSLTCLSNPSPLHVSTIPAEAPSQAVSQFQVYSKTQSFRDRFYPGLADSQWNSWHWQLQNRISTPSVLSRFLDLSLDEMGVFAELKTKLPLGITPYYMSLLHETRPGHPLRRTVVPTVHEFFQMPGESHDPLGEEGHTQIPGLVHRYPDRVLLLVSGFCSTYCRYCTRSRLVGRGKIYPSKSRLEKAIEYIRNTPSIRDVLLSGGDPLTLSDAKLDWILNKVREIPHVEIVRIGTKVPAVLPQRITPDLIRVLRKYHPLWMSLHFSHPEECTPEAYEACARLADAGIPLGSQTVLLKGINDDVLTMKNLMHHLMRMRVKPYYLYQCDPVTGTGHFRTSVDKGLEIIRGLRGHTSGYAVPTYVIDAPGGGGKIPLLPNYVVSHNDTEVVLQNYENRMFVYPNRADCLDAGC
ncbi:MAG: KamA family radical SAM protein [Thermodesulfobacteriota bacterium]